MQPLYSSNNKLIGYIDQNAKVLHKRFKGSKHIFKKDKSLGLDYEAWKTVLLPENYEIRALDEEKQIVYYTESKQFLGGHVKHFDNHALQVFLPLKNWKSKKIVLQPKLL